MTETELNVIAAEAIIGLDMSNDRAFYEQSNLDLAEAVVATVPAGLRCHPGSSADELRRDGIHPNGKATTRL